MILQQDLTSFIERSFYELHPGPPIGPCASYRSHRNQARSGASRRNQTSHHQSAAPSSEIALRLRGLHRVVTRSPPSKACDLRELWSGSCRGPCRGVPASYAEPLYRSLFGNVLGLRQAVNDCETIHGGRRLATSVGGVLTGRGADMIVLDDPQKADEALSEASRKATQTWFDNTLRSRLNDKANGVIIIVMQRLHQDDLIGHVLEQEHWEVLSLPAIAEVDECHLIEGPLGRRFFTRKPGDILHPARESASSLADTRRAISEFSFASQYQQNPIALERLNAIDAERRRRLYDAYRSNDQLLLGRLWYNRSTGTPEDRITDDQGDNLGVECAAIFEEIEREI